MNRLKVFRYACFFLGVLLAVITLDIGFDITGPLWAWVAIGAAAGMIWGAIVD